MLKIKAIECRMDYLGNVSKTEHVADLESINLTEQEIISTFIENGDLEGLRNKFYKIYDTELRTAFSKVDYKLAYDFNEEDSIETEDFGGFSFVFYRRGVRFYDFLNDKGEPMNEKSK